MSDGHINQCKECRKDEDRIKQQDPIWLEKERARGREKYRRLGCKKLSKEKRAEIMRRYVDKYPEKVIAKSAVGKMKPVIEGNELHHWSYNQSHYKDVIEVTIKEHGKLHRFIIYDQERRMYRTLEGELLDSRERHEDYIRRMLSEKPD